MTAKRKTAKKPEAAPAEVGIEAFKGFDRDWKCRGMQYAVGQTFEHEGSVAACESGLHACERPLDVLRYYRPSTSRFAIVRASGEISRRADDTKIATAKLTIEAEIGLPDIIQRTIAWTLARCTPAEGAHATKDNESASTSEARKSATASGYSGAATASGRKGRARGAAGCALFLVYRDENRKIVHARAAIVGENGIKPDTFYRVNEAGEIVEAS